MKEQDCNTRRQLLNLEDINNRLRNQLEKLEKENEVLKKQVDNSMNSHREVEKKQTRRPSLD